jgi:hypothetical protein
MANFFDDRESDLVDEIKRLDLELKKAKDLISKTIIHLERVERFDLVEQAKELIK